VLFINSENASCPSVNPVGGVAIVFPLNTAVLESLILFAVEVVFKLRYVICSVVILTDSESNLVLVTGPSKNDAVVLFILFGLSAFVAADPLSVVGFTSKVLFERKLLLFTNAII